MKKLLFGLIFFFAFITNLNAQLRRVDVTLANVVFSICDEDTTFKVQCNCFYYNDKDIEKEIYISLPVEIVKKFSMQKTYSISISPEYSGNGVSCVLLYGKLVELKIEKDVLICIFSTRIK